MAALQSVKKREGDIEQTPYWTHNYHALIHTKGSPNMHEIPRKIHSKQ